MSSGLVWFRKDLRLTDNPAWAAATSDNEAVVALFVIDPRLWDAVLPHRRAQLAANLRSLDRQLDSRGGRLKVEIGDPALALSYVTLPHLPFRLQPKPIKPSTGTRTYHPSRAVEMSWFGREPGSRSARSMARWCTNPVRW